MSDARLRALGRSAPLTPEEELDLLRARLREGELTSAALEVAAYCEHPAALTLLPEAVVGPEEPKAFVWGLARWGKALVIRAGWLAACLLAEGRQLREPAAIVSALDAVEAWLANSEAPVPPAPELTQSGAFDALLVLPLVALGQRLHGLDQDAVRTVATVVDVAQGLEHGADLRAGLAAWALSAG